MNRVVQVLMVLPAAVLVRVQMGEITLPEAVREVGTSGGLTLEDLVSDLDADVPEESKETVQVEAEGQNRRAEFLRLIPNMDTSLVDEFMAGKRTWPQTVKAAVAHWTVSGQWAQLLEARGHGDIAATFQRSGTAPEHVGIYVATVLAPMTPLPRA